jgi:hypothetical protein
VSSFIYSILLPSAFYFCLDLLVISSIYLRLPVRTFEICLRSSESKREMGSKPVPQVAPVLVSAVTFVPDDYQVSAYFDGALDRATF